MISSMLPLAGGGSCAKRARCEVMLATTAIASGAIEPILRSRSRPFESSTPTIPPLRFQLRPLVEAAVQDLARELVEQRRARRSVPAGRQQPVAEQRHGEHHTDHAAAGDRHVEVIEIDAEI